MSGTLNVLGTVLSNVSRLTCGGLEVVSSGGVVSGRVGSGTAISEGTVNVLSGGSLRTPGLERRRFNVHGTTLNNIAVDSGGIGMSRRWFYFAWWKRSARVFWRHA